LTDQSFCPRRASVYPPDLAAQRIIKELYQDAPISPILPKERKKLELELAERDTKIRERYSNGESARDLAKEYKLSEMRIYKILDLKKRK